MYKYELKKYINQKYNIKIRNDDFLTIFNKAISSICNYYNTDYYTLLNNQNPTIELVNNLNYLKLISVIN